MMTELKAGVASLLESRVLLTNIHLPLMQILTFYSTQTFDTCAMGMQATSQDCCQIWQKCCTVFVVAIRLRKTSQGKHPVFIPEISHPR